MSPHAGFVLINEIVPRLKSAIPHAVSPVGSEDLAELVQDGTAIAASILHNAEAAGKQVSAGNVAYYAIQHLRSGRRSTGSSVVDVMQPATQLTGHTQVVSLEALVPTEQGDNETYTLGDMLSRDCEDPAIIATRRLDWQCFCETQPARNRDILDCTAAGEPLTMVASKHGVSRSALQANKDVLARQIMAFMGQDILQEVARHPCGRTTWPPTAKGMPGEKEPKIRGTFPGLQVKRLWKGLIKSSTNGESSARVALFLSIRRVLSLPR